VICDLLNAGAANSDKLRRMKAICDEWYSIIEIPLLDVFLLCLPRTFVCFKYEPFC
jgi:hypothetical protein